jgi:hypothetical protein
MCLPYVPALFDVYAMCEKGGHLGPPLHTCGETEPENIPRLAFAIGLVPLGMRFLRNILGGQQLAIQCRHPRLIGWMRR